MSTDPLLNNLRILLVEDDVFLRRIIGQTLSGLRPKQIVTAEDGKDALSFLSNHRVDLLITDIQMPRMNGLELIRQIRLGKTARKPDLRTIVVTSFSTMEVVIASLALDVNGFLVKPITRASAARKIGIAMREQMRLRREDHYSSVNTNLESIAQTLGEKTQDVNASILWEENGEENNRWIRKSAGNEAKKVGLDQLQPGMCLMEDLKTTSGLTLVSAGQELSEGLINRVNELSRVLDNRQVRIR